MDKPAYRGKNAVPIHLCEHHLLKKGRQALARDDIKFGDTVRDLLRQSLHALAEWDALATALRAEPGWLSANKWVKPWDKRMRLQTARRSTPMVPWKHPSNAFVRCWSGDAGHSATVNE